MTWQTLGNPGRPGIMLSRRQARNPYVQEGLTPVRLSLGSYTIDWLDGGQFHLDAGAMFGVVPKPLWQGLYPVDDQNRMTLEASPLLIRPSSQSFPSSAAPQPSGAEQTFLVETGLGLRYTEKQKRNFLITRPDQVVQSLGRLGLEPLAIRHVLMSHMDFDHASGGVAAAGDAGVMLPRFAGARYWINRQEWHDLTHPNLRSAHTYREENALPLAAAGLLHLVDGRRQVAPGIELIHTGGHTRGHQILLLQSGGQTALYLGDLLPTHAHLNSLWVTAYDNFPLDSVSEKQKWLDFARSRSAWLLFYHDVVHCAIRLDSSGRIVATVPRTAVH